MTLENAIKCILAQGGEVTFRNGTAKAKVEKTTVKAKAKEKAKATPKAEKKAAKVEVDLSQFNF